MSRNFELIRQLEAEVDRTNAPRIIEHNQQYSLNDAGALFGDEIVALVQTAFLASSQHDTRKVLFCGVEDENGSSAVCASAARALSAVSDQSVCMVDADIRFARLSSAFDVKRVNHFPQAASSICEVCSPIGSKLWLAGPEVISDKYGALLPAADLKQRFAQLRETFDFVLVDAPGVAVSKDAAIVGEVVGAAILVVEANVTRRQAARRAKQSLESAGARIVGTVLRNRSFPIPDTVFKHL